MNRERSAEIEFLRGELVGPARPLDTVRPGVTVVFDAQRGFQEPADASGTLFWTPEGIHAPQEVVHYSGETPLQRYGTGLLHPQNDMRRPVNDDSSPRSQATGDSPGADAEIEVTQVVVVEAEERELQVTGPECSEAVDLEQDDDFEVVSADLYQPSVMGISFCLEDEPGEIVVSLPPQKKFFWQLPDATPFPVNGIYERCSKVVRPEGGSEQRFDAWRRLPATTSKSWERFVVGELQSGVAESRPLNLPCGLTLQIQLFPRRMLGKWVITCVLRNLQDAGNLNTQEERIRSVLFQTYFEVRVQAGAKFSRYPEGVRPFGQFDADEQTLALLYRDAATWAIGHGCAAAWEAADGDTPEVIFADVMPAVELPSMTPDIKGLDGQPITLSMRELAGLPSFAEAAGGWLTLNRLAGEYASWIAAREQDGAGLDPHYREVADRHLDACRQCLVRIRRGIAILQADQTALEAFRLANQAMMLQQIASKQIERRPLSRFDGYIAAKELAPSKARTAWDVWAAGSEGPKIGSWRAFQAAFLLMSIPGLVDEHSDDREIVDLIWFPTGGGKTEAYLAVAAFYMFHQRLIARIDDTLRRDGTSVFMRYTLRMLTTQQFQRAASLICAMEQIRVRRRAESALPELGDRRFSLGLWIGGDGSPNNWEAARSEIAKFSRGDVEGNPLVLTECPWCRSEIGRLASDRSARPGKRRENNLAGLAESNKRPYLKCSDTCCPYGGESSSLPVEVIDEAIYASPPSMFIGTADKFAMMAWKPETGALFGFRHGDSGAVTRVSQPPGLIIQDEFHLISGPLGTIYGLYEGVMEQLCSAEDRSGLIRPKIIASTATIRGSAEQVRAVYAREQLQLFPSPGLKMGDSFFGCYAKDGDRLADGRLYLGIHASGYRSFLTTQVRTFSAALFRPWLFDDSYKDAWWTLLAFYNSLRELGGARTLFNSDISARLKDYSYRYGLKGSEQRYLNAVEELTSRRGQAELVQMMDRLALEWKERGSIDACLASSIIEVGVDIDRLALMAVVGQPKSTAQYIQVTGRVGRRWAERPGLILSMYNPAKSRDRSHFEQFHSYHRRLYERVEPTSATPYSVESVERALAGVLLVWARQRYDAESPGEAFGSYDRYLEEALDLLLERCDAIVTEPAEAARVRTAMKKVGERLRKKWRGNPQQWWEYPQKAEGEYLMLWSGEYATREQQNKGERILSSMRNVDGNARAAISNNYFGEE
ncbi:MAG: hypothetical protein A3I66_16260 [Burkholderiales bacterium RIFCSPLOWO2_02_FULL_57_36]|nr:MAG: hypothetical protein A3I66_16260 [Burkholderiales bacterium RIFCSPLOWO2_02_FULL_57_36]